MLQEIVVVKQLDRNGVQGNREFLAEVLTLSLVNHPNLVNLLGYCADGQQRILVYEYISYFKQGMNTLTLSASVPAFIPTECVDGICPTATPAQYAVFFFGLYLIALGTGGIKPCVSSFGADQFDDTDDKERVKKGSFFKLLMLSV